jgi:hypothetical protein
MQFIGLYYTVSSECQLFKTSVSVYSINVAEKQITVISYSSAQPSVTTI